MSKKSLICIIIGLIALFIFPMTVNAEEKELTILTEIGFENKANPYNGFPVIVTVQNNSQRSISGDVAFTVSPSYSIGAADILKSIEIPADSEISFTISIPGYDYSSMSNIKSKSIRFFEGGWEEGKELEFEGKTLLTARGVNEEDTIIGLLSNDPEALSPIKSMQLAADVRYDVVEVQPNQIPEIGTGLNMLSILIVSDFDLTSLTEHQQRVIDSWVHDGGTMLVTGQVNEVDKDSIFYPNMPIQDVEELNNVDSRFLNDLTGRQFPGDTFTLFEGDQTENSIIHVKTSDDRPVLASRKIGNGELAQLLTSASTSSFTEWEDATKTWELVINPLMTNLSMNYGMSDYETYQYSFSYISNLFPSSLIPLSWLVAVFAGYIFILCPILYLVLKKSDKREHAWWLLPSISILLCVLIFLIGGKDRIKDNQINENAVVRIDDTGKGYGVGSASFLNSKSGAYKLEFTGNQFNPFPIIEDTSIGQSRGNIDASVMHDYEQQIVTYKNREFWSISNAVGPIHNIDTGLIDTDLTYANNEVRGTVINNTNFSFENLYFLAGNEKVDLGSFEKGEKRDISFALAGKTLFSPSNGNEYSTEDTLEEMIESGLFQASFSEEYYEKGHPAFAGITKDSILHATLNGQSGIQHVQNLVLQTASVSSEQQGSLTLENRDLSPTGYSYDGDTYFEEEVSQGEQKVFVGNGSYELAFSVPNDLLDGSFQFTNITISAFNEEETVYEIYNNESEAYEVLDGRIETEDPDIYIDEWGNIQLKVQKNDTKEMLDMPQIKVEGEFKHD